MATIKAKIEALKALLGGDDALITSILEQVNTTGKELSDAGVDVAYKGKKTDFGKGIILNKTEEDNVEEEDVEEEDVEAKEYLGDITVKEFGDLMAGILTAVLTPAQSGTPAAASMPPTQQQDSATLVRDTSKELDAMQSMEEKFIAQGKQIKKLMDTVKELNGETTRAAKGYLASSTDDNLVDGETVKGMGPHNDPMTGFMDFVISGNGGA
jgi:hypothetical protein